MESKTCTKCSAELPLTAFVLKDGKPYLPGSCLAASWCRACINFARRRRYDRQDGRTRDLNHYGTLRNRAARAGLTFNISFEQFCDTISKPCMFGAGMRPDISIGVDRKDSSLGYTSGNIGPCCQRHNLIKGQFFSDADMRLIMSLVPVARACGNCGSGRKRLSRLPSTEKAGTSTTNDAS